MGKFLRLQAGLPRSAAEDLTDRQITLVAGENLGAGVAVYISQGVTDAGRTAGRAYLLNPVSDNRIEFVGLTNASALAGANVVVTFHGVLSLFSGLTPGLPVYADPSTPGGITQVIPSTVGAYSIPIGQASAATDIRVYPDGAASAVFIDSLAQSSTTILNNQTSSVDISGMFFNGVQSGYIDYTINRQSSTTDFAQTGTLVITKRPVSGGWLISDEFAGDVSGVLFTISSSGQVSYTSSNIGGTSYVGTMKFNTRQAGNSLIRYTPTVQRFTSSGTYSVATGPLPLWIRVRMIGGGGSGGSNTSNGVNGSSTSFGSWTAAAGAGGNTNASGGAGGSGGINGTGTLISRVTGGTGGGSGGTNANGSSGGQGGNGIFGGGGGGGFGTYTTGVGAGADAAANSGAGGGGGGTGSGHTSGSGGGAGEGVEFTMLFSVANGSSYTIGTGGAGGGGAGASGVIIVEEFYQ